MDSGAEVNIDGIIVNSEGGATPPKNDNTLGWYDDVPLLHKTLHLEWFSWLLMSPDKETEFTLTDNSKT